MQQPFFSSYQRVSKFTEPATGLWLLHGDEPLFSQWLIEKLTPLWRQHGMAINRMDITSSKSWQDILLEINSLSLFDDSKVVIAQGNHKPDKHSFSQLESFISEKSDNCLLIIMDKIDKKSQNSAFFQLFLQHGYIVDCQLAHDNQRAELLLHHAHDFGLNLTTNAWQYLLSHTQNNLLTAYHSLWRLSYLYVQDLEMAKIQPILVDEYQLQDGLVSQSNFTTFDLSDAMLQGNLSKTLTILQQLQHADEPPSLVLWVIAKDMRNLQSLQTGASFQSLGIWQSKQGLYQQALQRFSGQSIGHWSNLLYECDRAIKGLIMQPAWELLRQLAMAVVGVNLFGNHH